MLRKSLLCTASRMTGRDNATSDEDTFQEGLSSKDVETQAAAIHHHVDGMTLEAVAALRSRSVPTIRKRLEHFAVLGGEELKVP
ncbi:hypothetical protein [Myxococcus sp. AB056]|uniref:hypothetical protein n=1 Tax=Myxococcus sp. AB056 TaxID=2562792 RepID=UPI0011473317|nr:hypothetical protein [Myxococcus sp. AB056]